MKRKDKKNNPYEKMISYGFIAVLGAVFLFSMHPDRQFSDRENRELQTFPSISVQDVRDKQFQEQFVSYKNDQFVGRDTWIQVKTTIERMLGKKEFNDVYLGKNDQLMEAFQPTTKVEDLANSLTAFAQAHSDLPISFLLAPTSISILADDLPDGILDSEQSTYMEELQSKISDDIHWIDVNNIMEEHKDEYLYYKSDHHWTSLGAYYAFTAFADDHELGYDAENWTSTLISDSFYGTLAGKSGYEAKQPDEIYAYLPSDTSLQYVVQYIDSQEKSTSIYASDNLYKKDQYSVFLNGNHPLIEIETTTKEDRRLLLIKDSYANEMVQFLLPYYSKITIIDPRYYNDDMEALMTDDEFTDILFLYNANTLFQDTSLSLMLD